MRALVLHSFGGPAATTVAHVAEPECPPGHVIVEIEAAAIGAWDV